MRIAHIYPIANAYQMRGQKVNMLLTHLALKYPAYAELCKQLSSEGSYTILDNSLIECKEALSIKDVCDVAENVMAREIILPDVFQDGTATIKACEESLEYLHDRYGSEIPFNIMAVAQGKTIEEFTSCFDYLNRHAEITCIGIPKVCAKLHPQGRPYFEKLWINSNKHIHLLGLWYSFEELKRYKNPGRIRSIDTCHKAFLQKNNLSLYSVRPDGFTLDLENDIIFEKRLKGMRRLECLIR